MPRYRIPVFAAEGVPTSKGIFDLLTWRKPPLPLAFQTDTQHSDVPTSDVVGQIVEFSKGAAGVVTAIIEVDENEPEAERAIRSIERGGQGVSLDGAVPLDAVISEVCLQEEDGFCVRSVPRYSAIEIGGGTLTPIPAFADAIVEPRPIDADSPGLGLALVASAMESAVVDLIARSDLPLTAGAAVELADWTPKLEHFDTPAIADDANVITLDGDRVFGWVATDACHQAFPEACVRAADQSRDLSRWLRNTLTLGGRSVPVGFLTMDRPHAGRQLRAEAAESHYDDTRAIVAIVTAGWDQDRIWFAGSVRPDLTEWDRTVLSVAAVSGDWRANHGERERTIRASLVVPVPGFLPDREPIVAAGCNGGPTCTCGPTATAVWPVTVAEGLALAEMAAERIAADLATLDGAIGYDPMEGLPEAI